MKMDFSKDELAMVYQYAAGTKEDTLAGLKEIVPVIRDRQTREIVEITIRKLDAIPEPECRRFIADTKQRFIQKRDNSIRRRLAEAKAQARLSLIRSSGLSRSGTIPSGAGLPKPRHRRGRKSHIPREKSQTGNGHNRFQSRSPWTAPLKEGAIIHHPEVGALRSPKAPRRRAVIIRSHGQLQIKQGTLRFPCAGCRQLPFCRLAIWRHLFNFDIIYA